MSSSLSLPREAPGSTWNVVPGKSSFLRSVRCDKVYGSSILRVAEIFSYVSTDDSVSDVSTAFLENPELQAVAVCDEFSNPVGLISRNRLFAHIGKPFGREVHSKKTIATLAEDVERFDAHANLFQVAEKLSASIDSSSVHYYLVVDANRKYAGIFSSKALLLYLSKMIQDDLFMAGRLQERMFQVSPIETEDWSANGFSISAKGLGGDFSIVSPLTDGRVFMAVGDVSGKGAAASILTSLVWGILRYYDYAKGLRPLLLQINEALIQTFHLEKYLTGIFMLFDAKTKVLTLADMGHGHGWIVRNAAVKPIRFGQLNLPLGIDTDLSPHVFRTTLKSGDLVVAYTDGLTEQENSEGVEWGEEALAELCRTAIVDVASLGARVRAKLGEHQGDVPPLDDTTFFQFFVR